MGIQQAYTIFPLGDSALIIEFASVIDKKINERVLQLFYLLKKLSLPAVLDVVPAYNSISVFYDLVAVKAKTGNDRTAFEMMAERMQRIIDKATMSLEYESRRIEIPVCYALPYAPDLELVADEKKISVDEIIRIHTSKDYRVFMIGFLPGFSYMGEVDDEIEIPRKPTPVNVLAGSVGIAGKQTGIYPLNSPGGWQIIGRTPLLLFDSKAAQPVLLQPGDTVHFFPITEYEFKNYQGRNS